MSRSRTAILAALLLAAAVVLGWLSSSGALAAVDGAWNALMIDLRVPLTVDAAYVLNALGGGWVATLLTPALILALLFALRRWRAAVYAAVTLLLSVALTQLLKEIFGRARPEELLVASDYGSFPSGHTANAATVAMVLFLVFRRRWVAVAGIVWVAAMAWSRTALSVHWLTDTVGGLLVGVGTALLVAALIGRWALRPRTAEEPRREAVSATAPTAEASLRPYRAADREAVYEVCVKTADTGGDATGMLTDDRLWGDIFAIPYVERHPDLAWVIEAADGRVVGYVVATDDTDAFEAWFRDQWWPSVAARHPISGDAEHARQDALISGAERRGAAREPYVAEYPAHLHIDLLPETQGQGWGRQLMQTLFAELRRRGVPGVHLGVNARNTGAIAFYERLGMQRRESTEYSIVFGMPLR